MALVRLILLLATSLVLTFSFAVFPPDYKGASALADDDDDDGGGDDDDDDDDGYRRPVRRAPTPVRQELVVAGLNDAQIRELERLGFRTNGRRPSSALNQSISRLQSPRGRSVAQALRIVRHVAPQAAAARNDLFRRHALSSYRPSGEPCGAQCEMFVLTAWRPAIGQCSEKLTIGVVDTGVDVAHPSIGGANIAVKNFRRSDRRPSDRLHGTGVVSLLVGQPGTNVVGLLPNAKVLAADAFHRVGAADAADAFDLIAALDWLAEQGADVINLSLSGPPNPIIENALKDIQRRGISIVAAAGKPESQTSGYPARYRDVIAVSAVDARMRVSRQSIRGEHVAFAAPGVGVTVAGRSGAVAEVTGTSFAAPFVAAAMGLQRAMGDTHEQASEKLKSAAKDLGAPGRDPIYGWGLVQFPGAPQC